MSTSTISPGTMYKGGFLLSPTPPGVPVTMTSPDDNAVNSEI